MELGGTQVMSRCIIFIGVLLLFAGSVSATRIANANVDLLKGYAQNIEQNGDTTRYYMGRVMYNFFADDNDSIIIDFTIHQVGTETLLDVFEKTGDLGFIKQRTPADTLKIGYFRVKITGSTAGNYIGGLVAYADRSRKQILADSLVNLMTPEQKQSLTYVSMSNPLYKYFGQDNFNLTDGTTIVGWRCSDGPHGVRFPLGPANEYAIYGAGDTVTLFPTEACLGCSWDRDLTYDIGKAIAQESRAMGLYCNLGPMSDLVINPRWGRAFETMGEDPYHVGQMASSQVRGLQSEKVIATPKHFGPYISEKDRGALIVHVEERAFRELFCEPFRTCIQEGGARAIMTCYHRVWILGYNTVGSDAIDAINKGGDYAGANRHNLSILRNDWGFDGVVMTDWDGTGAVDSKYSYDSDYDMSMPAGKGGFTEAAANIKSGTWSQEMLDRRAKRIMYDKLWAWDGKLVPDDEALKTEPRSVILSEDHLALSLKAAREGITLVKNDPVDDAPILPLSAAAPLKIAVVGPYANVPRPGGGGSSAVTPDKIITPLEGMQAIAAANPSITITTDYNTADVAVVCVGTSGETEDADRSSMALPSSPIDQNALVASVMSKVKKTIVVYTGGSASYAGKWSEAPAIVVAFYPGRFQGEAIAEVLFGIVNPGGHLNVTFPKTISDLPKYDYDNYVLNASSVDTAHGYFLFEKKGITPLFWFGHGLSYTTFAYNSIRTIGGSSISAGDRVDVEVTLTNTGTLAGDDVVQLYVKPKCGTMPRRVKDLRGFARVSLQPGEAKTAFFVLGPRDFSVYEADITTKSGKWVLVPGEYDLIAGSTSDPTVLTGNNGQSVITSLTVN